ncbi:leukemia inhibitory factor receptor isoform X1 [Larimichthys crocea]|nr:leukemia inhibitory factor receptor isoform X1 [Larimichthys crocea]XP_027134447.1 leukemia inhibitory factor receptor isoform X1 [Larimichthys crocea]
MIRWFLLFSLFCKSTQDANGQENGVSHCGPQNLTLTSSDQMILLTWEDEPSCSTLHDVLIYELVFLIEDKTVDNVEVAVTPEQIGSTHSWNWTSHLALECASHSVRLRSRYKNQTSSWKHEQKSPEIKTLQEGEVFPKDRVFKVGSTVTFCCVLPEGILFNKMYLNRFESNTTQISNQTYAMTVRLEKAATPSCAIVTCELSDRNKRSPKACVYIGYPPDDRDLQCETRDLRSVECHWNVGRETHVPQKSKTIYHLLGRECVNVKGECKMNVQVDAGERNWTLTAENQLGKVELTDRADLTKRVHMSPPEQLKASTVNARNITLEWVWTEPLYYNLSLICQVNINHSETNTITEKFGVGLHFVVLNDLIPHWTYDVKVRCGTTPHFWKWSSWSTGTNFNTKGDVPDALDVWRQVTGNHVIILWKMPLDNQSHGHIEDYEVTWAKTADRKPNRTKFHNKDRAELSLDTSEEYIVTVTARNAYGSSSPSTVVIPSLNPDGTERVNTSQVIGSNGSISLSWSASPTASCGYIVDWCRTLECSNVEWLKVAPGETSASIFSKTFIGGVRYSFSVYACTQEAPVLLERREGYVHEKSMEDNLFKLKFKQQGSDVVVSWDQINLRKQSAFIRGYVLYCEANNKIINNVSTDNTDATSLKVENLSTGFYKFRLKAKTTDGECGTTEIAATLDSQTDTMVSSVVICLVTVFVVLSLITVLCYRHWACIKRKVYPPIPKPVLTEKWFTSQGENHFLRVDQHHSEGDTVNVSELHCNSVALENGYISQENMPFVFSQTPKGYYNQPLKISIPPPLTFTTTAVSSQSEAPCSPFKGVFRNPSYNLIMQKCTTGDQQSNSDPELQEGTPLERSSSGYQPQSITETLTVNQTTDDLESPVSCVSTYILLPKSPSN